MTESLFKSRLAALLATGLLALLVATEAGAAMDGLPDFTGLVEEASPAVVNISTTTKVTRQQPNPRSGPAPGPGPGPHGQQRPETPFDEFLRRFFGDDFGGLEEFDEQSLGSGFIVSDDGYVLTNNHVIGNADEIIVRLSDRREFVAEVVGTDERSDVALLKIDAEDLPVARIGRSADLKVGSWVVAIGSPFGFDHTVTAGIVSAKGRSLPNENYTPFIQTDVAINPGNSGGPLLNMEGEVVGVNSQIFSRTGGFMGLSFAIPIDLAMEVVDQLRTKGHVSRGWLGILIQDVTRELAESFGMSRPVGALVARVLPDSPAEAAGIQVGDIIVEYNGRPVESSSALPPMVGATAVDSDAEVKVMREGEERTLKVTISELPEDDAQASGRSAPSGTIERIDVRVSDLTEEQRAELDGRSGVLVDSVEQGAAARAGVRRGDIILRFDNVEIENVAQLRKLVEEAPAGKSVPLLVQRRGSPIFLALKLDD